MQFATSAEQCLTLVWDFEPDLVLLDVVLPGVSGHEACRSIKTSPFGPFTQVILLSTKGAISDRLRGYDALADDYLAKPFDREELLSKVRVHFRLRRAHSQLWQAQRQIQRQNYQLKELVAQRTDEALSAKDAVVFGMAELAESRDPETGQHLIRMRGYAQVIAEELGRRGPYAEQITADFLENLFRATPLHDIGKVGIPDAILKKPGKLTPEEFEIMKRHVLIGADTLERAISHSGDQGFLRLAAEVARYHHERYDGKGYCSGLKGQAIPLAARIAALADVFDALTSKRIYKEAIPAEESLRIIVEELGHHFDPFVVDAFCWGFNRVLEVYLRYADDATISSDMCTLGPKEKETPRQSTAFIGPLPADINDAVASALVLPIG